MEFAREYDRVLGSFHQAKAKCLQELEKTEILPKDSETLEQRFKRRVWEMLRDGDSIDKIVTTLACKPVDVYSLVAKSKNKVLINLGNIYYIPILKDVLNAYKLGYDVERISKILMIDVENVEKYVKYIQSFMKKNKSLSDEKKEEEQGKDVDDWVDFEVLGFKKKDVLNLIKWVEKGFSAHEVADLLGVTGSQVAKCRRLLTSKSIMIRTGKIMYSAGYAEEDSERMRVAMEALSSEDKSKILELVRNKVSTSEIVDKLGFSEDAVLAVKLEFLMRWKKK